MSFKYYSGFCLKDEKELFNDYLIENDFTVSGFSYGAIKAFEEALHSKTRVDLLQLFSPAFFKDRDKKYKRMQLLFFKKDAKNYCNEFLKNIAKPSTFETSKYFIQDSYEDLEKLLTYEWSEEKLQMLVDKGTKIEVYLGSEDQIINSLKAKELFVNFATVYYIKEVGHILKSNL